jgi:hypothetical protein
MAASIPQTAGAVSRFSDLDGEADILGSAREMGEVLAAIASSLIAKGGLAGKNSPALHRLERRRGVAGSPSEVLNG